jgi:RNA polymerase sigma-70 factor, ECF subfamily
MTDFNLEKTVNLLAAGKNGDRDAIDELFHRYLPRLRQFVALRIGKPIHRLAETSDIVQEALINGFRKSDSFEWRSDGGFLAWLGKIAENKIYEEGRAAQGRKRDLPTPDDLDLTVTMFPAGCPSPLSEFEEKERSELVQDAILSLVEPYRDVIGMRDVLQMSFTEIGAELDRREDNCRKLYQRARQALREALESRGMGASDAK